MKLPEQKITKEQKQAIGLLSIGTFLEYFDLMLYVHMAVLLNDLFFPKTDPFVASLLTAFTFCATYVFRPIGALIFGYIGDNIGRKVTVILTTFLMAGSCLVMSILPTYAEIGIYASFGMILCRIIQGMSAMGECIGAELYLTEITKPPIQYVVVSFIGISTGVGATIALAFASFTTSHGLNWRYAFFAGTIIALIGGAARTRLRETPDFADAKRRVKNIVVKTDIDLEILEQSDIWKEKLNKMTAISLFLIQCGWPICFYFVYIYCGDILKNKFNYTSEQVIHQNFIVSMVQLISSIVYGLLSYKIYPLIMLKVRLIISLIIAILSPYLLYNATSSFDILIMQIIFILFAFSDFPAAPIFYKHFPVFKRYTFACMMYALGRGLTYIVTSFGLIYLVKYLGHYGFLVIILPVILGYGIGLFHFEKLEVGMRKRSQER
jgi:MHS family proline/betaine transporter-like MFS transporter